MSTKVKPLPTINPNEIARKGEEIYEKNLKDKIEKDYYGKFVAIEVETGKYFLGETLDEASNKAKKKYPDKINYIKKIGFPAVFTMSHHFKPSLYGSTF